MRKPLLRWSLTAIAATVLALLPVLATALPPRPTGGSCEICTGRFMNRFCSTSQAGYKSCETDTFGNCIAQTPCGGSLTVTP